MIITKTPLRISLVGGGSDISAYYRNHGRGAVVSFTIDKYIYIFVNPKFDGKIRISYAITENVDDALQVKHDLVKGCLSRMGIDSGIEIVSIADIPGKGTGLGSSSAFTVGLLNALNQHRILYQGEGFEPIVDVAEEACKIEIEKCSKPIGKQDQYACAYGSLNYFQFFDDEHVGIERIRLDYAFQRELEDNLMLFYTGTSRSSETILFEQREATKRFEETQDTLTEMVELADRMFLQLSAGDLGEVGHLLDLNWKLKKSLVSKISNENIDSFYRRAKKSRCDWGKIMWRRWCWIYAYIRSP